MNSTREKRIRQLARSANRLRKIQAKKINILCNDLINAQRHFIQKLKTITFSSTFYKSVIGIRDLSSLIYTAGKLISEQIPNTNIDFVLQQDDNYQLHSLEGNKNVTSTEATLQSRLNPEIVNNICKANRACKLDDLFEMGLYGSGKIFKNLSVLTIPLGSFGSCFGFIMLHCSDNTPLTAEQIEAIQSITPGLSKAITSCQAVHN